MMSIMTMREINIEKYKKDDITKSQMKQKQKLFLL